MAMKTDAGDSDELKSEINIIPLVDVMLVLLIIFMVAAPMMNESVDVTLPKAKAQASDAQEESVILSVKQDQSLFLGRTPIKREELIPKLTPIFSNRDKKEIFVKADERVTHGFIIKLMADIQRAGVFRISFMTDPAN